MNRAGYPGTLNKKGRLHFLGAVLEPVSINVKQLMGSQLSISSSPVGGPAVIKEMLDFAARHAIEPRTEHFAFDEVNAAVAHLKNGKARYRVVLSRR